MIYAGAEVLFYAPRCGRQRPRAGRDLRRHPQRAPAHERDRLPERLRVRNRDRLRPRPGRRPGRRRPASTRTRRSRRWLTVGLGLALLAVGLQAAARGRPRPEARSSRAAAILAGLSNVGPAASFSMAGLLGFGGPKRLLLTFLAMASVTEAGLRDIVESPWSWRTSPCPPSLVSVPVGIVVVAGDRAAAILARGQSWVSEHARRCACGSPSWSEGRSWWTGCCGS